MFFKIELPAVSLTDYTGSFRQSNKVRNEVTPIFPKPDTHSYLTTGERSFVAPSMNINSP